MQLFLDEEVTALPHLLEIDRPDAVLYDIGGLVNDGTALVITRVVKGMSAAFTAPAGLSIITTTFAEGPNRNRALAGLIPAARERLAPDGA